MASYPRATTARTPIAASGSIGAIAHGVSQTGALRRRAWLHPTRRRQPGALPVPTWELVLAGLSLALLLTGDLTPRAWANGDAGSWSARVTGTQGSGLIVRSGPSQAFPALLALPEGARVQVLYGPQFDQEGRGWYAVTDGSSGRWGWSAGDYLSPLDPGDGDALSAARSQPAVRRSFLVRATAYSYQVPAEGAHGSLTRLGTTVHWGTVSVDPTVIPLGSRLLIEGYDTVFVAEDTGGGVHGNRIDIFFPDEAAAIRFGVQDRIVTVLP